MAQKKMAALAKGRKTPSKTSVPHFETAIISGKSCPNCGHVLEEPWAGAIEIVDFRNGRVSWNIDDPVFERREAAAKAKAFRAWQKTDAGKAWARHKAKPSKASYLAYTAAQEAQDKRHRAAKAKGGTK
jgi:hypothetical protein